MVMLSIFFVGAFYKSIWMITESLKSNKTFAAYVNERLIFVQLVSCLVQFLLFILFIISKEVELFVQVSSKDTMDYSPWCKANISVAFFNVLMQLGMIF